MHNLYRTSLYTTPCSFNYNAKTGISTLNSLNTKQDQIWPFSFTFEVLDDLRRPLYLRHLKFLFPRWGEQCPVVEFSYKGYSLPKCSCNDKHTHIPVKLCTFLLECLHAIPHASSPHRLPHTCIYHVWEIVFKTKIFVLENSLDNLRY